MPRKLTLDDLRVDSFETTATPGERGTVYGLQTEIISGCASGSPDCPDYTNGCPDTDPSPTRESCTWYAVATCETNQIAFPSECTGCGVDCAPTYDWCPTVGPGWNC